MYNSLVIARICRNAINVVRDIIGESISHVSLINYLNARTMMRETEITNRARTQDRVS